MIANLLSKFSLTSQSPYTRKLWTHSQGGLKVWAFCFKMLWDFICFITDLPSFNVNIMPLPLRPKERQGLLPWQLGLPASHPHPSTHSLDTLGASSSWGSYVNRFSFSEWQPVKGSWVAFNWRQKRQDRILLDKILEK